MNLIVLFVMIFFIAFITLELTLHAYRKATAVDRTVLDEKKKRTLFRSDEENLPEMIHDNRLSDIGFMHTILSIVPGMRKLSRMLRQSNVSIKPGFFMLLVPFLAILGYTLCSCFLGWLASLIVAGVVAALPVYVISVKKGRRVRKFERQLPDALELIARSLRAGQSFPSGLALAAREFDDPLGPEFEETINEINFGISVPNALKSLAGRIQSSDLDFFIASSILQRDVGGNLAEIMEIIGRIVRERLKLRKRVVALTAEVRYSGIVLMVLPFVIFALMSIVNPDHFDALIHTETGRILSGSTVSLMFLGLLFMRKIVTFKI